MSDDAGRARLLRDLERRRGFRLELVLDVLLLDPEGGEGWTCRLVNVGSDGVCIELPMELNVGDVVTVRWPEELGPGIKPLEIACQVAWTVTDLCDPPWPTGFSFVELDERRRKRLYDLILKEATR